MSQPTAEDLREIIGIDDAPYQAILDHYYLIDKTEAVWCGRRYATALDFVDCRKGNLCHDCQAKAKKVQLPEPVSLHGMSVRDWSTKVYQFMQAVKRHLEGGE